MYPEHVYYKQVGCKCIWDTCIKSGEGKKVLVWYKKTIVICHYEGVLHMYKCTGCTVGTSIIYRSI